MNGTASLSYGLDGGTLGMDAPVEVARAHGHFWFPTLHPAGDAGVFCEVVTAADKAQGKWPARISLSQDGGTSWQWAADLDSYGPASLAISPRKTLLLPYETWPLSPGDKRSAVAEGTLLTFEGGAVSMEPTPVRFLGFPQDLADYHEGELCLLSNGSVQPLSDGSLLTTLYGTFAGEEKYTCFALTTRDAGRSWHFCSVVASWRQVPDAPEGPCECDTVRLSDGRLMCILRVGSGRAHLFHRSLSADEGRTWSAPEAMPGLWSVEPRLARLENGTLLLAGGRHGLFLWVCVDGLGHQWQKVNLSEHHNALVSDPSLRFSEAFCLAADSDGPAESTSYTGLLRIGPNEALICYDRLGNGWSGAPGPHGEHDVVFAVRLAL